MRKTSEELNTLVSKLGTDRLWSWSRINSVHNSLYEYYLKYIAHEKEDRADSIYVVTGGLSHDILEKLYNKELSYEEMIGEFEDAWITSYDIAELKFDRNDSSKNENIAVKYRYDLSHFFKNHIKIPYKLLTEQFITINIGDEYLQGYIDAMCKDNEGNYIITDWKTSTVYQGDKAKNECGQLVVYAIGLNQLGIPFDKIKIRWNFLKYQTITVQMKNGTTKDRNIERCKIGESLQANAKMWLKELGYADQVEEYLGLLISTNDIKCLPEEVRQKYIVNDCYVYVELTDELINNWIEYVTKTIQFIRQKEEEYKSSKDESIWMESQEEVSANSYYYSTLMAYSPSKHKPYKMYLDKLESEKNGSIFGSKKIEDEDMSWLNDL